MSQPEKTLLLSFQKTFSINFWKSFSIILVPWSVWEFFVMELSKYFITYNLQDTIDNEKVFGALLIDLSEKIEVLIANLMLIDLISLH